MTIRPRQLRAVIAARGRLRDLAGAVHAQAAYQASKPTAPGRQPGSGLAPTTCVEPSPGNTSRLPASARARPRASASFGAHSSTTYRERPLIRSTTRHQPCTLGAGASKKRSFA